ncbi:MAG: hypothetical protein M3032_03455 [Verrucomicrobiota bacterium]|nr:hypothetical protein [Verrucomicrobiota bacterium]
MAEPTDPIPPVTPTPAFTNDPGASTTGLPSNVAAALACIPLVGGIIFYILEKRDSFVRFYAMQSIIFGGAWIMFDIVYRIVHAIFSSIPAIGGLFVVLWALVWALVSIAFLVVFIICVVKAFSGVRWEIPYIGPMARNQVDGTSTTSI